MGDFPAFSWSGKHSIYCSLHFLLVEEGQAFGVNFGASELEQTLAGFSGFLTRISKIVRQNFLGRFEGSNTDPNSASSWRS